MNEAHKEPVFTRLYIIRHGQTDWNKKGIIQAGIENSLNEEGIQQAQALSARMADTYPVDTILSSPAIRARETASVINQIYHADIEILNDLIEIDFGDLKNHIIEKLPETQPEYIRQFNHFLTTNREDGTPRPDLPNGESSTQMEKRIGNLIEYILKTHTGKKIAVVTHGTFIKCLMTYLSGVPLRNYMPFWIDNASLSIVDFWEMIPVIRSVNDIGHLKCPPAFIAPRIL